MPQQPAPSGRNASHAAMLRVTNFWRFGRVDEALHLCLNRCRRSRNGDAAFFLEDHGCVLTKADADKPRDVDCKASRASLVEHSIAAKEEEARKEAQRKAEIVPISFS